MRVCAGILLLALLAGCGPWRGRSLRPPAPPLEKITIIDTRVPRPGELPAVVGRLQHHRVRPRETLLDVARDAGLGFGALHDANPGVDEWVPLPDAEVVVPSRWIIPRSRYRGLIVNIPEMRLYMFPADARPGQQVPMLTWAVGIGLEEAPSPVGPFTVRSKDANPTWIVPASILRTMEKPERIVAPGPDNPLGAYRIRLSKGLYSIHGTNDPWSIGRLTTHGCIRLYPEDIEVLYPLVDRGAPGELLYQPVKIGEDAGRIYVEVHDDVYRRIRDLERHAFAEVEKAGLATQVDGALLRAAVHQKSGIPVDVTRSPERTRGGAQAPAPRSESPARRLLPSTRR